MTLSTKLASRAPVLLRHARRLPVPGRQLTTTSFRAPSKLLASAIKPGFIQKRNFSTTGICFTGSVATAQEAPNPKAYLESGVIKPRDVVGVKKVLVIGSGGLAIGQAGEFDYSGRCCIVLFCIYGKVALPFAKSRVTHSSTESKGY